MSFGAYLDGLAIDGLGSAYVGIMHYSGGTQQASFSSVALAVMTKEVSWVLYPQTTIDSWVIYTYPSVTVNRTVVDGVGTLTVTASGGNVACDIMLLVR